LHGQPLLFDAHTPRHLLWDVSFLLARRLLTNDVHNKHTFMFLAKIVAFFKTFLIGSEDPEAISLCDKKIDKMGAFSNAITATNIHAIH